MSDDDTNNLFDEHGRPIFDIAILSTSEKFKQYLYEMKFEDAPALDMTIDGYMEAIRPYLKTWSEEILFSHVTNAGGYVQVQVRFELLSGLVYNEISDAFGSLRDTPTRLAITSAFKRGSGRILGITAAAFGRINVIEFNLDDYKRGTKKSENRPIKPGDAKRVVERPERRSRAPAPTPIEDSAGLKDW